MESVSGRGAEPGDSAIARIFHGGPGAKPLTESRERRLFGLELLVVLAIFPLGSTLVATIALVQRITLPYPIPTNLGLEFPHQWLTILFAVLEVLTELAGAVLVWYLLVRSGEGLAAINLGARKLRIDLALLLPLFFLVEVFPQWFGTGILGWTHLHVYFPYGPYVSKPTLTTIIALQGLGAGVLEEVVVLGYLVRRLEQRGYKLPPW